MPTHLGAAVDNAATAISPVKQPVTPTTPRSAAQMIPASKSPKAPVVQAQSSDTLPQSYVSQSVVQEAETVINAGPEETTLQQPSLHTLEKPNAQTTQLRPLENVSQADEDGGALQGISTVPGVPATPVKTKESSKRRPLPDKPTKRAQDQTDTGPTPFKPANHYAHLSTDSKIRTAQALDIVEYLLRNNGGIFPGDKALFYAVLRIYLKAFSGQMPPSFSNLKHAIRRLAAKGKAREIVHAFRAPNGKYVTSSMLLATEMDPNSLVPTVVKRKIQDAYPGVFIPPAFSPSKEELRLLEEFDGEPAEAEETPKATGKFRLRRDNTEVEIMNAPYYQENPLEVGGQYLSAAGGQATPVSSLGVDEASKKRRKRASTLSAADQASGRSAKKQKTLGSKLLGLPPTRKIDEEAAREATDDEMGGMGPPTPEPEGAGPELSTVDSTPVASAIKAYGLLPPPRTGPKKRRPVDTLVKLPREVGCAQNPGLTSLPHFFFANQYNEYWSQHVHSMSLTFLDPNTRLDDYHVTSWFKDLENSVALVDDTSSIATDEETMSLTEQEEPARVEGFSFVPLVFLKEYSRGVWPKNPPMELFEKSIQMQGWNPSPQDVLRQLLPADIEEMASWNKRKRARMDLCVDAAFAEFDELIDRCEGWELSSKGTEMMLFSTLAPEYRFINASPPVSICQTKAVVPVWDDENQFTLETFPYKLATTLAGDEDEEPPHKKPKLDLLRRKPRGRPPGKKASPKKDRAGDAHEPKEKKRMGRKPKRIRLPALEAEREHTAYPQSAEEYMDIHHGAERTPEWNSEHTQLAAFVCVTTLLGGVAKSVDWGIMMRLFPDMSLSHLRKFFGEMNKDRKSTIIDLTEKFQKAFLEAYEKGELPPLDYDNVLAYDWKALTLWTRGLAGDESTLPPSYAELEKRDMVVSDRAHQPRDWRETFWLPARSLYNRYQDSSSQAFATVIDPEPGVEDEDDNLRVAMSWVRALCVTAPHPPEIVSDKWETFKGLPRATISDLIDKSIRILQEKLVITKDKNLIVMRLNDRVVKALGKAAQDQKFAEAARFKRRLDKAFRKGKTRYRIPYTADDDGLTMALLNLQAHGRVRVETDNKDVPLGYEPFNYETRKFDRKYHHFRLWAVPTERYLYSTLPEDYDGEENDELAVLLSNIQATSPPVEGSQGELPLWVDFFGKVDEARWRKCLGAVLFMLSTRGPMRADAIADQLKCFVPFEVQMVLDWADGLGLLEQMTPEAPKCVTEWWWLAVGAQRRRAEGASGTKKKGKWVERAGTAGDGGLGEGSPAKSRT
ncbi:Transcription factor tau subunit sfc3 [Coniochaeta hoffmannii]|uniref:Transcription factor tau subunit sfc3 n=1 Tax=Coniochaeta hoffmannii TaxID=91930 RepID=A0AA38RSK0_9PEZI|nr:Transcription factor tau subunit sfc3 [Coniochaeta hoffmannii]